jgi:hypothetical protein
MVGVAGNIGVNNCRCELQEVNGSWPAVPGGTERADRAQSSSMDSMAPDMLPPDAKEFEELVDLLEKYEAGQGQGFGPLPEDLQVSCCCCCLSEASPSVPWSNHAGTT